MAPPTPPSRAKPTPPASESPAFSVPPDLVTPPPYTSPTAPSRSSPVPTPSPSTPAPPNLSPFNPTPASFAPVPAPEASPPAPDSPAINPILYPPLPPVNPFSSPVSSHTRSHSNPPGASPPPPPAPLLPLQQVAGAEGLAQVASPPPPPAPLLPLRQVAGAEGLAQVHVPFSLQDLAQIEAKLGSFSSNPTQYIKQFTGLTRAYALTWQDIYVILGSTTTPEERQAIWTAARAQADQRHCANPSPERPPGAQAVPDTDPDWNYQEGGGGQLRVRYMIECILDGMQTSSHKVVNLLRLDEVTQGPDENPAMFLNRLTEALVQYTRLSPESPTGAATLANRFISQSAPDIRKKLAKAEDGPQTPIRDLVKMAFKVYNAREKTAEASQKARLKQEAEFQASLLNQQTQALIVALRLAAGSGSQNPPPGACFKCGQEGHWAKMCPNPRPPSKPCPLCKQRGHWASDCPQASQAPTSRGRGPERPRETSCPPPAFKLLSFEDG
ncbi:uncharacterized protein LOC133044263 [Dama dama]|uniref:uncharacterized protein LOC133044263 n=1 Tax=Dama dama TaxID=30532 RepID=UPI002A36E5D4|nr:uncharacterized protein LOC133044263 [Dama dama]